VIVTIIWIISGGIAHGHFFEPVKHINDGLELNFAFASALGYASVKSVYCYLGYYNVCHLGGEIINPQRNIPRSMIISISGIALLYLCMNISVASVLPLPQIMKSDFVISEFMEQLSGPRAATVATVLILCIAFASIFSATLGYSRIPYAAAKDGAFFRIFSRLHPTKNFPYVSLLFLGGIAFIFSMLFKLSEVISAILAMRIMIQFIGQAIGLLVLSKRKGRDFVQWKMPFFPIPVIIAILIWVAIFVATGWGMMLASVGVTMLGILIYYLKNRIAANQ
jgi:amino acid transporter